MSRKMCVDHCKQLGNDFISLSRYRFFQSHLQVHSPTIQTEGSGPTWFYERDQTQKIAAFEYLLMQKSRRLFFVLLHLVMTIDDELMGTRSMDNPVTTLSNRKAGSARQSTDVLSDAIFRFIMCVRFRRRGESTDSSVTQELSHLF